MITSFILQANKFLKCDWLRPVLFKLARKITLVSMVTEKLLFIILNQWRIDFPILTRKNCNSLRKMMMNEEQLMTINNFHGCQVTINYQLSQKFPEPRCNVLRAEPLIDMPVKNFHPLEQRPTDIRVQFHQSCVMLERSHVCKSNQLHVTKFVCYVKCGISLPSSINRK